MSYLISPVPCINVSSSQNQSLPASTNTPPANQVAITFDTTNVSNGIRLVSNSQITVDSHGFYLFTFSAVVDSTANKTVAELWFKRNGNNIANTNTTTYASSNGNPAICTVSWIQELNANDYVEIWGDSSNGDAFLSATAATGSVPASPSIIFTVNKVSN